MLTTQSVKKPAPASRTGFTLIEISIVLVIIGLVVGGILVGRDLIRAAEIRAMVTQYRDFDVATTTFVNKYQCLPGDCGQGSVFGFDASANGDGNHIIGCPMHDKSACNSNAEQAYYDSPESREYVHFWYHLSAAGLIAHNAPLYSAYSQPDHHAARISPAVKLRPKFHGNMVGWVIRGGYTAYTGETVQPYSFNISQLSPLSYNENGFYPPQVIYQIDAKLDDALPLSGQVRVYEFYPADPFIVKHGVFPNPGGPTVNSCVRNDVTPWAYNAVNSESGPCTLTIKASF